MKWNSTITAIGSEALDPADNIVILFIKLLISCGMLLYYKGSIQQHQ